MAQLAASRRVPVQHGGGQPVSRWFDADYWRALNPGCSVGSTRHPDLSGQEALLEPAVLAEFKARMDRDGYFDLSAAVMAATASGKGYGALVSRLAVAVRTLVAHGWPATFIVVYDEAWELVTLLAGVMRAATGGNACMMDLVAWHVDPSAAEAGFTPHRDRHLGLREQDTDAVQAGFREPGGCAPRDSTCWIALSEATPDNGCLYFLPRSADPAYALGDCSDAVRGGGGPSAPPRPGTVELIQGPLGTGVYSPSTDSAWQHVRAVPCTPGSAVLFSHRVVYVQ